MNSTLTSDTPQNVTNQVDLELVDESVLEQMIRDTSADIIPILIDHYVTESQTRLLAIREATSNRDAQTLEFEVHTLGSTALSLGNRPLGELSRALEQKCLEQEHDEAFLRIDELLELADRSIKALLERKEVGFS
ncbi:signal transduction histidine kinase [Vibrio crassostreae]|uniref:Hpt domain-containing protein n=1 Tax=Vibrio crassostreae TaxID=246167 RepID=UPI000F4A39E7|nr:Hpt domain-containing protein [Vibrio crassostreae]ROR26930.1 signal transduction histidine kinase [Vibrio crassostreae]TWD35097.1 signal transduction histidine kinase [Vibrio crassostreae]